MICLCLSCECYQQRTREGRGGGRLLPFWMCSWKEFLVVENVNFEIQKFKISIRQNIDPAPSKYPPCNEIRFYIEVTVFHRKGAIVLGDEHSPCGRVDLKSTTMWSEVDFPIRLGWFWYYLALRHSLILEMQGEQTGFWVCKYSKIRVKQPLSKRPQIGFQDRLMQLASIAECSKGSILQ